MAFPAAGRLTSPSNRRATTFQLRPQSIDSSKQKILSQNRALAKKNSVLMTKIADLETKISDLIQQNIELRALNAKNEDQKRRCLEDKLNVIEAGVSQRFEEMFQMFATIRNNEGLSESKMIAALPGINVNDITLSSASEKTVSFVSNVKASEDQTEEGNKLSREKRRRKSARRESIYIPPPSPPRVTEEEEAMTTLLTTSNTVTTTTTTTTAAAAVAASIPIDFEEPNPFHNKPVDTVESKNLSDLDEGHGELARSVILSPIKTSTSSPSVRETSKKSMFEVYEDSPEPMDILKNQGEGEDDIQQKIQRLADESVRPTSFGKILPSTLLDGDESTNSEITDEYKPLEQDATKIKHTKTKRKSRTSVDEKMPTLVVDNDDLLSTRKSRTRGKQISYAEPSLRVKMRRQSEKFVDAVADGGFVKPPQKSLSAEPEDISRPEETKPTEEIAAQEQASKHDENGKEKRARPLIEQDNSNITKRRRPLSSITQNKIQKVVDSDKLRQHKRFELSDDELSVFDLVEESAVGVPKTFKKPDLGSAKKKNPRRHSMLV
ncbi:Sgo1p CYBJADRAFT_186466 [Cyberlindnera jadinii NRRL Y-1542]|uniref:Shugoshin n=1 Tax=Cyberlindnera jadinii (strain ATCC 18201 / CBS 1600 / BCRC 20928 / JCM 3617 / NBRC 0987 / NRRL Y-1542) TaxID=983966 RepID=A0A1E4RWG5_CYBJN|nr:hypothetical protein CYBJADRAFT_186466 [Cyberlindnera jadinii NRRL Y-1542]ODV71586.1 hypothetical protein CYBJADRAFT_186466 [Cyberlindnera jadinii NRRL Y-1542]